MTLLFVYGTLKKGYWNNRLLANADFCSTWDTPPSFDIHPVDPDGGFPILVKGREVVSGELYRVTPDTLRLCDHLEGHPHMYERRTWFDERINEPISYYHWLHDYTPSETQIKRRNDGSKEWVGK